ncbi:hypothetical protein Syun_008599 [Stephania yunnanensis]|uniref:Cytochrome P450 n=1 Tax=Stephania yunnanensis TaxID=152371 RepID=A0AAP0KE41_9MAGN
MELLQVLFYISLFILLLAINKFPLLIRTRNRLPPSPPGALPIIGHLRLLSLPIPLHRTLQTLSAKSNQYANYMLLKLGTRNLLVLSSPAAVEECFHKNDVTCANRLRTIAYDYYSYNYTTMATSNYGPHWRNLRRITSTNIFCPSSLHASSGIRHDAVRCLLRELYKSTVNKGPQKIDLKLKFYELTFNSVVATLTGEPIGDGLWHSKENNWFFELLRSARVPSLFMAPADYLPFLRYLDVLKVEKVLAAKSRQRDEYFAGMIKRFRKEFDVEKKSKTTLDMFFSLQQEDPEQYNDVIIKGIIQAMFTAGIDTSAMTLEWAMSLLLNNPETLKKALIELDQNIKPHRLLEDSDLSDLPYIQCIVQETLRLFPPAPLLLPHESACDFKADEYDVPSGTIIVANAWAIQRDPKVWAEPDKFMPERFMESLLHGDGKDKFKFMPFGIGRRVCPGWGLAMRMIPLALGSLLKCFEWEKISDEPIDMTEGVQILLPKAKALEALCRPRSEMLNALCQL